MEKFNPSDKDIALIEELLRKVISLNLKSGLDIDFDITNKGVYLFSYSEQGGVSWNNCSAARTDEDFRSMFRWLCEQERKEEDAKTI